MQSFNPSDWEDHQIVGDNLQIDSNIFEFNTRHVQYSNIERKSLDALHNSRPNVLNSVRYWMSQQPISSFRNEQVQFFGEWLRLTDYFIRKRNNNE
jgi:hypothetical protein